MKKIGFVIMIVIAVAILAGGNSSCKRDVFDQDTYKEIADTVSPVDSIDPNHTWELSTQKTLILNINAGVGAKKLMILTDDPATTSSAKIIAQRDVEENDQFSTTISYPQLLSTIYAALIDAEGNYTVTKIKPSSSNRVDFSSPMYKSKKVNYTPQLQYYTYCFESEYPEFGDYDYNDLIMRIALEHSAPKEMRIHVQIAALGCNRPLTGEIRFPTENKDEEHGLITMKDIDSVYTVDGKSFNVNMHGETITKQNMNILKTTDLLLEGMNGEPILNLFVDAHWAMGDMRENEYGVYDRKYYNVSQSSGTSSSGTTYQVTVPREVVYVLKLKEDLPLNYLTLDNIDPFIQEKYSANTYEVHTYPYKSVMALNKYQYVDTKNLPWSLVVPSGTFNHPLEGVKIGFKKEENGYVMLFGAYPTKTHAFGEWAENRNKSTDWYLYPETSEVFIW